MTQPLDRNCRLPKLGALDEDAGEFWVENPFLMPQTGTNLSAYERNCLFLNVQGRRFVDASFASGSDLDSDSRSVIAADFDNDGAPDLLVGSVGGGPLRLFRNRLPQTERVRLSLRGQQSPRSGIGARVTAWIGERRIVRDIFPSNGCQGQGPAACSIGAGPAGKIDRIRIRWPSGTTQDLMNVTANAGMQVIHERESARIDG